MQINCMNLMNIYRLYIDLIVNTNDAALRSCSVSEDYTVCQRPQKCDKWCESTEQKASHKLYWLAFVLSNLKKNPT